MEDLQMDSAVAFFRTSPKASTFFYSVR